MGTTNHKKGTKNTKFLEKTNLRKQGIVVTNDTNKSAALGTFKKNEQKLRFLVSFWLSSSE